MRDEVLFSCNWDFQNPLKFSESSEIFSFLQNSEIFKFAEGNTELLPSENMAKNLAAKFPPDLELQCNGKLFSKVG